MIEKIRKPDKIEKLSNTKNNCLKCVNTYIEALTNIQEEVAGSLEEQFLESGIFDANVSSKYVAVLSTFASANSCTHNRTYKLLLKCYDFWKDKLRSVIEDIPKEHNILFTDLPHKLAGCFFINGDYYKALFCLRDAIRLDPTDVVSRTLAIKWAVYLGEWEMAELAIEFEESRASEDSMSKIERELIDFVCKSSKCFIEYNRVNKSRGTTAKMLLELFSKAENYKEKQKTYHSYEMITYINWICAQLPKAMAFKCEAELLDTVNCLNRAQLRSEHVLRNRLPGILKEKSRINMKKHLENSYEFLKMGACVAEACDIFRDYSLELFNVGMLRESISNAQLALWCSLKTAVQFRVQQFINIVVLIRSCVQISEYHSELPQYRESMRMLYSDSSMSISTPDAGKAKISHRSKSPSRVASAATKLLESFSELRITEPVCSLHNLSKHCDCNLCEMCRTNYNASFEYYLSYFLFEGMSDVSLECLKDYFFSLRVRVAVEQCSVLEKKVKPRPPALMCELFGMAVVRWLRHLEIVGWDKTDVKRVALRNNMMEVAAKICSYSSMRTICYSLAISHLLRREKAIHRFEYSWMQDEEFQRDRKLAFLTDVVQCLSPYPVNINKCGGGSTISPVVSSSVISFSKRSADAMIIEARKEYSVYSHLFYRDWRFPVCTYMGEGCSSPWEAAMMWAESTVLATRQAGRYLSGKIKGFAYQESSLFKKMVENLPEDFTVIQLALSEGGSLYLVKLHRDREPIIVPLAPAYKVKAMCKKMDKILSANDETGYLGRNSKDAKAYWVARRNVDQQLKDLLPEIETSLLGPSAALLIASATMKKSSKGMAAAERIVRASRTRDGSCLSISSAKELVALSIQLKENEWMALAERLCDLSGLSLTQKEAVSAEYSRAMKIACMEDELDQVDRRYTFLLICPDLALIPWEVLPNFCDRRYVGRIASLHAFFRLLNKYQKVPRPVNVHNSYYVLDPDNTLGATQKRLTEYLAKFNWNGIVGQAPKNDEFKDVLQKKDVFFYMGHGSGSKHLSRRAIKDVTCNAVSVLMGCGSVKMVAEGWGMDGKSSIYDYTIAECPSIVGCLWMVTDGEIDRYFMALVDACFSADGNRTISGDDDGTRLRILVEAMHKAKDRCKLRYLTGAAVVSYGIPIVASE